MLRKLVLGLALAGGAALPLAGVAEAAIGDGVAASHIAARLIPVEKAQFFFGGRNFCFYDDGWHGPGYYWCGYANRNGIGWGGGDGWNGWHGGGNHGGNAGGYHGGARSSLRTSGGVHAGAGHSGAGHSGARHASGGHAGGTHHR